MSKYSTIMGESLPTAGSAISFRQLMDSMPLGSDFMLKLSDNVPRHLTRVEFIRGRIMMRADPISVTTEVENMNLRDFRSLFASIGHAKALVIGDAYVYHFHAVNGLYRPLLSSTFSDGELSLRFGPTLPDLNIYK